MSGYLDAYLLDTCAWSRMQQEADLWDLWADDIDDGRVWICDPVRLEMLTSSRSTADRDQLVDDLFELFGTPVSADRGVWRLADTIHAALTAKGLQRGPGVVDILLCATAVRHGMIVISEDGDIRTVAGVVPELRRVDVREGPPGEPRPPMTAD
ncbi:PIN domain-containing protein [Nocardiopsis lambiniae]|uniref:Ribonuclease VapC n=1 Tax=Nocardiopsis lambiniae TaxID=3075539 RepID=A0ABU2M4Y7_9ACTN|nr:PIN domain-containing protein [Nocardiopsis sp. DSM 44743]MDT0327672.1 PIN domain-containing protein [Nocardiopsis sp. DSM 44743]